jgi:hypothetical protein
MTVVIYALSFGAVASLGMIGLGWAAGKFLSVVE